MRTESRATPARRDRRGAVRKPGPVRAAAKKAKVARDDAERPRRADARRCIERILEIADAVLDRDPAASLQSVAEAAGVTRMTVYRHFSGREELIRSMARVRLAQLEEAFDRARMDTAPPAVALHQLTAEALQVNARWRFISSQPVEEALARTVLPRLHRRLDALFVRARAAGMVGEKVDPTWVRWAYIALLRQAKTSQRELDLDLDALADLVVRTLLRGIGADTPASARTILNK